MERAGEAGASEAGLILLDQLGTDGGLEGRCQAGRGERREMGACLRPRAFRRGLDRAGHLQRGQSGCPWHPSLRTGWEEGAPRAILD